MTVRILWATPTALSRLTEYRGIPSSTSRIFTEKVGALRAYQMLAPALCYGITRSLP